MKMPMIFTLNESENETPPIDYLSLEPERIVSITRSRTPSQQLEFLLKCTRCPTKLYFISNEKAKELVPDLLIDFYERHINWFIDPTIIATENSKTKILMYASSSCYCCCSSEKKSTNAFFFVY